MPHLLHIISTAIVHAGIAKNLAITIVTAQSASHMTETTWAWKTLAGCRPQARGSNRTGNDVNKPIVKAGNDSCYWQVAIDVDT